VSNARAIETTTVVVLSSVLEAGRVAEDAAVHRPARAGFARLWLLIGLFLVLASAFLVASWPVHHGHWRALKPIVDALHSHA
jgi:hypothetical protein